MGSAGFHNKFSEAAEGRRGVAPIRHREPGPGDAEE